MRQLVQAGMALQDEIRYKDAKIAQLTNGITALRRYQFG
jgi:hypothetical protein